MPASVQSQVIAHVVALHAAIAGSPMSAWRTRVTPFAEHELPAVNILPDEGDAEYLDTDGIDRRFKFIARYTALSVDQVDAAVDPLYVAGQKALFADTTLGGLVRVIREVGQKWEFESGLHDEVALVVTYEVEFSTSRLDPSVKSY